MGDQFKLDCGWHVLYSLEMKTLIQINNTAEDFLFHYYCLYFMENIRVVNYSLRNWLRDSRLFCTCSSNISICKENKNLRTANVNHTYWNISILPLYVNDQSGKDLVLRTFRMLQSSASVSRWLTCMMSGLSTSYRLVHSDSNIALTTHTHIVVYYFHRIKSKFLCQESFQTLFHGIQKRGFQPVKLTQELGWSWWRSEKRAGVHLHTRGPWMRSRSAPTSTNMILRQLPHF